MEFTTNDILTKAQTEYDKLLLDAKVEEKDKLTAEILLNEEKEKLIISNDTYANCLYLEKLNNTLKKLKW